MQVLIDFLLVLQDCLKERELQLTHRDSGIAQRKVDFSTASLTGATYLYYINLRIIGSYLHGGAFLTSFNLGLCISHIPDLPSYQTHHGLQQIR